MNSIEVHMNDYCDEYDLYISSSLRCYSIISEEIGYESYDILYKDNPKKFKNIIKNFIKVSKDLNKIFIGINSKKAVFINFSKDSLRFINSYLSSHKIGSKIVRIILSNEICEKEPVKVYPKRNNFKYKPDKSNDNLYLYYPKESQYFYYPK